MNLHRVERDAPGRLLESAALALELERDGAVHEAVQDRGAHRGIAEVLAHSCTTRFGHHHDACAALAALVDDGLQQIGVGIRDAPREETDRRVWLRIALLDDLSYARRDQAETSVLFELIAECYERKSLATTANAPFSEWDSGVHGQGHDRGRGGSPGAPLEILEMNTSELDS